MVVRFWVVSRTRLSLREALIEYIDRNQRAEPEEFPIGLGKEKKAGRNPGWAKAYSRTGSQGVVNFEWSPRSRMLECQAVSKGDGNAYPLLGEFISVVMRLPGKLVKSIHIDADRTRH